MKKALVIVFKYFFVFTLVLFQTNQVLARPKIGLVLGGGGARGAAHIGVLEKLEEMRIPIDCVAGTSIGSLIAGAYAAGIDLNEMKKQIEQTDWVDIFTENTDANLLDYRQRRLAQRFYPRLEMGLTENGVQTPQGLVAGEKIKLFFNRLVRADQIDQRIENLSLPLAIIATDLASGEKMVFTKGNLTRAMRASMAVPGVMSPETIDGHKLVDGGLVDNVPIDEARKLCNPDLVIAIDVGTPLLKSEEITSAIDVAAQMVNILTYQNVQASIASLKPDDIFIRPNLDDVSAGDFDRQLIAIEHGRQAMQDEKLIARLKKLSVDESTYLAWQQEIHKPLPHPRPVDEIQVADLRFVNKKAIEENIYVKEGEVINTPKLNQGLLAIYGMGDYETVDYELLDERDRRILRILPVEKAWGPDYLRFGLNVVSNFSEISSYNIRAAYQRTWMNHLGGEWLTAIQLGQNSNVSTEWYQPLNSTRKWFVRPKFSWGNRYRGIYEDDNHLADLRIRETDLRFDFGYNLGSRGQATLGWLNQDLQSKVDIGSPEIGSTSVRLGGPAFALDFDTFDKLFFPTKGWSVHSEVFRAQSTSHELDRYTRAMLEIDGVQSILGDHLLLRIKLRGSGALEGTVPLADAFALGGLHNLSGFALNQIVGGESYFGMLKLERKIGQMPIGLGGNLYAGLSLEAGRVNQRYTETKIDGWQFANSIYLGGDTPLGPVYLGYGYAEGGHSSFYLFIGTP